MIQIKGKRNVFIMRIGICMILIMNICLSYAQTGIGDNFNDNTLSCHWNGYSNYTLTESGSELGITASVTSGSYVVYDLYFTSQNVSANPVLTVKVRSTSTFTLRADLQDASGNSTNASPVSAVISNSGTYNTYTFNFAGRFNQSFPSAATVNSTQIAKIIFFVNPGGAAFSNTFYMDDVQLGTGGVTDGAVAGCPPVPPATVTSNIRLNQVGFYTNCPKVAILYGTPSGTSFYVKSPDLSTTYYTGTIGSASTWSFSNESVRQADFTSFSTPGQYRVDVPGIGCSYLFTIGTNIHHPVGKAALKAFYYNRGSVATLAAHVGAYARAMGHPDNTVYIHASAASGARPAGTVVSSAKGWYDAGDYNSYIVNSGITTYTLLASYEHFKSYFDTLNLNIPESGGTMPDILDEIKWNLDWMLTMQDPNDGGVYHKKTCLGFDGIVMPAGSTCTRYLVAKSTAATFDFAAVMATAYRIYKPYNITYANTCLTAAQNAYNWGLANPTVYFTNPGGVSTGEYGDGNVSDEREWAATELYIATLNQALYYGNSFKNTNNYGIPAWPEVRTLGLMSLVHHRKNLTASGFADTVNMKNKLTAAANTYSNHWASASAYKVAMGGGGNGDFVWGSNGQASNIGMVLLAAYEISSNLNHYHAALSNLDYLLGRNATTYSFVTGYGTKRVMHPHHRLSEADALADPVPGMLAGGPNTDAPGDCGSGYPSTTYKGICYQDNWCSYSTNEIAINWNAPLVYLATAAEILTPCGTSALPVTLLDFNGKWEDRKIKLQWITVQEYNNLGFQIQRSENGKDFSPVGFVKAQSGQDELHYEYYDENPVSQNYYRLKQVDVNGNITYSHTILLEKEEEIKIFPNPASSGITIQTGQGIYTISITDLSGKTMFVREVSGKDSYNQYECPLMQFAPGIYIVRIDSAIDTRTERLIIE